MDKTIIEVPEKEIEIIYAPNSIWHGSPIANHSKYSLQNIEISRLNDFIDFLFEHSEHCDHISQPEAWKEFEEFEINNKPFCYTSQSKTNKNEK